MTFTISSTSPLRGGSKPVSDWLKIRIKNTRKTFLIVGIENEISRILHYNSQLSRLFAARTTLPPFPWHAETRQEIEEFDLFVRQVEVALDIHLSEQLPRVELLYRIHYATHGLVGNVVTLLRYATILATEDHTSQIDIHTLSLAFESSMRQHLRLQQNPFDRTHGQRFAP